MANILTNLEHIVSLSKSKNWTLELRNRHIFFFDIVALLFIPVLALILRVDGVNWWPRFGQSLIFYTIVAILVKVPIFYSLGLYRRYWRYASVNDLTMVIIAVAFSTTILWVMVLGTHTGLVRYGLAFPRTAPLIDGLLTVLAAGGIRFCLRGLRYWQQQGVGGGRRVLVVGAGETGTLVIREMRANPQLNMEPVAFVDDNLAKVGADILGLPVLGSSADIPELIERYQIQRIIVAMPSASLKRRQEIIALCNQTGITTESVPGIYELLAGSKTISRLPKIDINQLLRREPVLIDQAEVAVALKGATVLVTGAGGSIGGELCRQVARLDPKEIILLGHGENSIFEIDLDLRLSFPNLRIHRAIMDIRDNNQISWVVRKYRPDVIFHAAAHKHVPYMEANVEEAITNNVLGTQTVLRAAEQFEVNRFILISTDKAINPTSIMGATKRIAELLVVATARRTGRAYLAVRFGNVLGSRGSVIPVFQRQIAAGGPLTITHPDMSRYFMTIPEAVQLVLQASVLGRSGELFVLDMGQPVRIVDLATDLIKLSGLEPGRDININFTGIRPGEKLSEELFLDEEDYQRTKHKQIFMATNGVTIPPENLEEAVTMLINLAQQRQTQIALRQMRAIIPEYQPEPLCSEPAVRSDALPSGSIPPLYPGFEKNQL